MNIGLHSNCWLKFLCRCNHTLSSKIIRNRFLEYFIDKNDHHYIKSSPVTPYFDTSIPFINAGMCQFKRIFIGEEDLEYSKIANTQKCIRVGGLHDDLNIVGVDSYHHTFFEMLGNWSFGSYSKRTACKLAWELLTSDPFKIPVNRLYVTYFAGDKNLNIPADTDIQQIWLEIGIPIDHIIPFSSNENFWNMGLTGPCGTCTEIHVALTDEFSSTPNLINTNHPLLIELWNLVFIKYNRMHDFTIEPLQREYIDTGMGLERLVTVVQQKNSSYETDLFTPLFDCIAKVCRTSTYQNMYHLNNLDMAYRQLADFSRMITVAVSDNVFPEENHRLRHILRKSLYIIEKKFLFESPGKLLFELSKIVAEILHEVFPEIEKNLGLINSVIENEAELVRKLKKMNIKKLEQGSALEDMDFTGYPTLLSAYSYLQKHISSCSDSIVPPKITHTLCNQFGLDKNIIEELLFKFGLRTNWLEVEELWKEQRLASREQIYMSSNFLETLAQAGIKTDDSAKYIFEENLLNKKQIIRIPDVTATIIAIVSDTKVISIINIENLNCFKSLLNNEINVNTKEIGLIFDKTNFYSEAGGQCSDKGNIIVESNDHKSSTLKVKKVTNYKNIIVHYCLIDDKNSNCNINIRAGNNVTLKIDDYHRLKAMRNHTASHLLTSAIKEQFPMSYYKGGYVDSERVESVFGIFGKKLFREECAAVEETLKKNISNKLAVNTLVTSNTVHLLHLPDLLFTVDGKYPYSTFRVITISDQNNSIVSRELCCGTHVKNTSDIESICVTKMIKSSPWKLNVVCVTGDKVNTVLENTKKIEKKIQEFTEITDKIINSNEDPKPEQV